MPARKKRFASISDLAAEGMSKETSLGRKVWIWFCLVFLALFVVAKTFKIL